MNVFITGGSGFLGKRLVSRLIKKQYTEKELLNLPSFITHPLANSIELVWRLLRKNINPYLLEKWDFNN